MREFLLSIVNPERTVLEERVVHVRLPGSEGYFGVMAGHMPFFAQLQYGVGEYRRADGVTRKFTVLGGFAEVLPDRTIVLADGAELADEIDPDRAPRRPAPRAGGTQPTAVGRGAGRGAPRR
jgi:F-type H+-transporting ATPase subunit epsilon